MTSTRTWLRRNVIGIHLILATLALILVTVTWPEQSETLEYRTPVRTYAAGTTGDVEGTHFSVRQVEPDLASTPFGLSDVKAEERDGRRPKDGKVLVYAFTVEPSPALSDNPPVCVATATDGTRRWFEARLYSLTTWQMDNGYKSHCTFEQNFVLAFIVPKDADVSAVDVMILPVIEGDAVAANSLGYVVRFETG